MKEAPQDHILSAGLCSSGLCTKVQSEKGETSMERWGGVRCCGSSDMPVVWCYDGVCYTLPSALQCGFNLLCVHRTVWPNWALPSSCAHSPTQNAPRTVRVVVLMWSATWTAALKTATSLTLWTPAGRSGRLTHPFVLLVRGCER